MSAPILQRNDYSIDSLLLDNSVELAHDTQHPRIYETLSDKRSLLLRNESDNVIAEVSTIEGLTHEFDRRWACAHYQYSLAQSGMAQQPVNEHTPANHESQRQRHCKERHPVAVSNYSDAFDILQITEEQCWPEHKDRAESETRRAHCLQNMCHQFADRPRGCDVVQIEKVKNELTDDRRQQDLVNAALVEEYEGVKGLESDVNAQYDYGDKDPRLDRRNRQSLKPETTSKHRCD